MRPEQHFAVVQHLSEAIDEIDSSLVHANDQSEVSDYTYQHVMIHLCASWYEMSDRHDGNWFHELGISIPLFCSNMVLKNIAQLEEVAVPSNKNQELAVEYAALSCMVCRVLKTELLGDPTNSSGLRLLCDAVKYLCLAWHGGRKYGLLEAPLIVPNWGAQFVLAEESKGLPEQK